MCVCVCVCVCVCHKQTDLSSAVVKLLKDCTGWGSRVRNKGKEAAEGRGKGRTLVTCFGLCFLSNTSILFLPLPLPSSSPSSPSYSACLYPTCISLGKCGGADGKRRVAAPGEVILSDRPRGGTGWGGVGQRVT